MSLRRGGRRPRWPPRSAWVVAGWPAGFVVAFYAILYPIRGFRVAIGSDIPVYVWWARYAGASGLGPLGTRGRPAIVALLGSLAKVTGTSEAAVAEVAGPVLAAALALATGALVARAFGSGRVRFVLTVLLTGSFLSLMVAGYLSTLAFGSAFVAALATMAGEGLEPGPWRPVLATAVLVAAAGLAHLQFLALAAAVVAGSIIALGPASRRDLRAGAGLAGTAAGRVALAVGGGAAGALAGFLGVGGGPPAPETSRDAVLRRLELPRLLVASYRRKLVHDFPWYRTLTVLGLASTAAASDPPRRSSRSERGSVLRSWLTEQHRPALLLWGAVTAWLGVTIGALLVLAAGRASPGQRLAAFCLPLPLLAAIGLASRRRAVSVAGAVVFLTVAWLAWGRQVPLVGPLAVAETRAAGVALAHQPPGTPMILVADDRGDKPGLFITRYANYLRDSVPSARVPDVHVFVGTPGDLLAGRPTLTGEAEHDLLATSSWREVTSLLGRKPVAVAIRAFDPEAFRAAASLPGSAPLAEGVVTLPGMRGSACQPSCAPSDARLTDPGAGPLSPWLSVWLAPVLLALLWVLGVPWAMLSLPTAQPLVQVALGPAFGAAALSLWSVLADAAGVRIAGAGAWMALAMTALGWVLLAGARRDPASA